MGVSIHTPIQGVTHNSLVSTSNHNLLLVRITARCSISFDSYIKPQLAPITLLPVIRCISFDSYIKPQRGANWTLWTSGCISFDSYIKPQQDGRTYLCCRVVYLLTPTSNHNLSGSPSGGHKLYIF